jgi:hypothetical protein
MKVSGKQYLLILILCLPAALWSANQGTPDSWIPARWTGGPLELERRARAKTAPSDAAIRDAIASWYDPATLRLLEGSPINCLLLTWSAGGDREIERQQQQIVSAYAAEAHRRGIAVLGLVYPGADSSRFVAPALDARLDGLVLDGEFPGGFTGQVTKAWASANSAAVVIPIATDTSTIRTSRLPVLAVEGVSPSARNLSDMGIRGAPSSEPWIQSNVWLVHSFRLAPVWRPVWISYQPDGGTAADYARSVADAAVAGGRWIVAPDDGLRAKLRRHDAAALAAWQRIGTCLKFDEDHAEWHSFVPYGNLGVIVDTAADSGMADEYLKLVVRRHVPYRPILRSQLSARLLAGFRAVLATALEPPSAAERKMLTTFAENGGLVVAGPSWGNPPKDEPFADVPVGKGRVTVYKHPDPESVARDMRDLLSHREAGVAVFNVPSVITYASRSGDGNRLLVHLLNYSDFPSTAITIRVSGSFKTARLFTPDAAPAQLAMSPAEGQIDITIPKLSLWGGLLLE